MADKDYGWCPECNLCCELDGSGKLPPHSPFPGVETTEWECGGTGKSPDRTAKKKAP